MVMNSGLAIMPTRNMINNMGATGGALILREASPPCLAVCAACSPCAALK